MTALQREARHSLGAGLASLGTVLLLIAGLLVTVAPPGYTEAAGATVTGDCAGWYITASDLHDYVTIDGSGPYSPGTTITIADTSLTTSRSFVVAWWQTKAGGDDLKKTVTVTGTRDDCTPPTVPACVPTEEIPGNGVDEDCDGLDGALWFLDADGDGFGNNGGSTVLGTEAGPGPGQSDTMDDCNDADASIYPGAPEIVGDGIDQDCDGVDVAAEADVVVCHVTSSLSNPYVEVSIPPGTWNDPTDPQHHGTHHTSTKFGYTWTDYLLGDAAECMGSIVPTLTLVKTWSPAGAAPWDGFAMFVTPAEGDAIAMANGVAVELDPGSYTAWETEPTAAAYEAGVWGGDCTATGSVTLAVGEHKTCTITNTLHALPSLTVTKTVVGGPYDGDSSAFTLRVDGDTKTWGVAMEFGGPGTHTVSEIPVTGYEATFAGHCDAEGSVSVGWDETKTCTVTNTYTLGALTVTKVVYGDALPDDFDLVVDGNPVTSGVKVWDLAVGAHTVAETLFAPYEFLSFDGACDAEGEVTLAAGDDLTCTIYNRDPSATTLTLTKVVIGGEAVPDDFDLTIDGVVVSSGVPVQVTPGIHTIGETLVDGYVVYSGWDGTGCVADEGDDTVGTATLEFADNITCTITNIDPNPKLTLVNIVVGGPLAGNPDAFDLRVLFEGDVEVADAKAHVRRLIDLITPMLSGVKAAFLPGDYRAAQTNQPNYQAGPWGDDCAADGAVTLHPVTAELQDYLLCTITNIYVAPPPTPPPGGPVIRSGTTSTTAIELARTDDGVLELARTGGGIVMLSSLIGGLGLVLLGAGLVLLAPRRRPYLIV